MYFDYFSIGKNAPTKTSIHEIQLAKYIATEWLPSALLSAINGFSDVIRSAIYPETIGGKSIWCVNPELDATDRQWKGVTSWLLGVAFARFVIEEEQYPWWSPVSAFNGPTSTGMTKTGSWLMSRPRSYFSIRKKAGATSNLLPDYLVCKPNQKGGFEFAFVESKGTKGSIKSWITAPFSWSAQSKSAELFYNSVSEPVGRNIVVATRINPRAQRTTNRRIVVRAWNRHDLIESTNPEIFAHYLSNHYAAVCWRIGYRRLGQLMEIVSMSITNEGVNRNFLNRQVAEQDFETELDTLMKVENNISTLNVRVGPAILDQLVSPLNLSLGQISITARLTRSALQIMREIIISPPNQLTQNIQSTLDGIASLRNDLKSSLNPSLAVTLNGIAVFDQNLLV